MSLMPMSLMMVIFTPSFAMFDVDRLCHIKPEDVGHIFIRAQGSNHDVYINEQKFTCACGQAGESVHIYPDEVLVCCHEHRPTVK